VTSFLPPQSAEPAAAVPLALPDVPDAGELLSLPHALRVSPAMAVADTVVRNALPKMFRFTCPAFHEHAGLTGFQCFSPGKLCGGNGRHPHAR
jgi:hypothetical protein